MTEWLHFHFSLLCTGEGNGNPLQCSCLENPRDRGACWAAACGVAQSRTRLEWLSSKTAKPERLPKDILNPQTPETYYWTLCCPSETRPSLINQNTGISSPTMKILQVTLTQPHPWEQTPQPRSMILRTFSSFLNHTVYSPYIFLSSH